MRRSVLFMELMKFADHLPNLEIMLLENVRHILSHKMSKVFKAVLKELTSRTFTVKWVTLKASMFGAHHGRSRWFCLAYRDGMLIKYLREKIEPATPELLAALQQQEWNAGAKLQLDKYLVPTLDDETKARLDMMGNAVVPVCAKVSLAILVHM